VRALQARRQCLARILILEGHSPPDLAHQSVQHASGAAPASTPRIGRRTRAALQAGDAAKHVESGLAGYDPEGQERDLTSVGFGKVSSRFFLRLIYSENEPHDAHHGTNGPPGKKNSRVN